MNHGSIAATSSSPTNRLAHASHAGTRTTATTAAASTAARATTVLRLLPGLRPARNAQTAAGIPHHRLATLVPAAPTAPMNKPADSTGAGTRTFLITDLTDATLRNSPGSAALPKVSCRHGPHPRGHLRSGAGLTA